MIELAAFELDALPRLVEAVGTEGALQGVWSRVHFDSRSIESGDLFVAVPGQTADGHAYVAAAAARGAAAAVVERFVPGAPIAQVRVASARRALAVLASEETSHPSREMIMVGVTGTNGKTTTTHLVRGALAAAGHRVGVVGTVGYEFGSERRPAPHTTPEAPELQRMLRAWRGRGASAVAMEVSSHALAQDRTYGTAFDVGIFTNLTQDHLDFHGTLESYREAKARLFQGAGRGDRTKRFVGAMNIDDEAGRWIRARCDGPTVGFGRSPAAEVRAEEVQPDPAGTRLRIREREAAHSVTLRLRGEFNAMNALGAFAACRALGLPAETVAAGLATVAAVPGRLEPVECGQPFLVLVDYAHTPDALERALEAVRSMRPRRLVCVFGCGGDRDRGKRPQMGAAAARLADEVILTSDNPRSESPAAILAEIEAGARGAAHVRTVEDRAAAIRAAVDACAAGDALLIAGKGHETVQIIGDRTLPFDDRDAARDALRLRGYGC